MHIFENVFERKITITFAWRDGSTSFLFESFFIAS